MNSGPVTPAYDFLVGGGQVGALMRAHAWAASPLGAPATWPQSLRSIAGLLLASKFPMFVAWGPELGFLYNDPYAAILAGKHPLALGARFRDIWSEIWPDIRPMIDRALAGEATYAENMPLTLNRNGVDEQTWFTFSYSPVRDESGKVAGMFCACTETTAQVLAERRLAQESKRQRRLFQGAPGFITVVRGPDHVFEFVNDAFRKTFGERDYIGNALRGVFPELAGQGYFELMDRVYATGKGVVVSSMPFKLAATAGVPARRGLIDFVYEPVIDEAGTVEGIFCEGHEVTARAQAEAALRQLNETLELQVVERTAALRASEARLRSVFEASYQYQGLMALDGTLLDANATSLAGIAAKLEDVVGRPFWETPWFTGTPGMPEAVRAAVARVAAGETVRQEIVVDLPTGTRAFHFSMRPVRNERGEVSFIVPEAVEVTERREAEEQLRQAQKMEAIGQLTGGVAHDFNNLLTIIRSSTDLLRRPNLSAERRRRYMDAIAETVDRAAKLTGQLLAFARRQSLRPETFDVGERIRSVADMLRSVMGARIRIDVHVPGERCLVQADISQFETALVNMAVNARDAMDGQGSLTIEVAGPSEIAGRRRPGRSSAAFVAISLSDTGAGIAGDKLTKIFEPFFTTKEVGKGTGLGLSQVYGFAKQSGGDVEVESQPGRGTTFTLYLPSVEREVGSEAMAQTGGPARSAAGGGRRVLVVEDNVDVGLFSMQLLRDLGYQTTWAASADEALMLLANDGNGFDVVFSDVMMPGMSGIELGQEIRRRYPDLPVILTSGYSHVLAEQGRHGFELLQKPYAVEELSRLLHRVARMARAAK